MTDKLLVPEKVVLVYRCLKGAAEHGDLCPSNNFLAGVAGYSKAASATDAVALLESTGMIEVTRFNRARVVKILETGKSTAPVAGQALRYLGGRRRIAA